MPSAWKEQFIESISNFDNDYGIPKSVTIAQACLESFFGKYHLGVNNIFGFKGKGPAGSVSKKTKEYRKETNDWVTIYQNFRAYNTFHESLDDHDRLLSTSKYYKEARKHLDDPKMFAQKLTGVYATDPNYHNKLIDIMNQYDLYKYDKKKYRI